MAMQEFQCEACGMNFQTKVDLIDHKAMIHSRFECPICGAEFETQEELKAHGAKEHEVAA